MSSDLDTRFEQAAEKARSIQGVSTDNKKKLYAYYKQATLGPIKDNPTVTRPGIFDQVGRAKYDAWAELGETNMTKDEAKKLYIELVESL